MKLVKLSANYNGYGRYSHRIEFPGAVAGRQQFVMIRNWLWEKFGPSAELENLTAAWRCWGAWRYWDPDSSSGEPRIEGFPLWSWDSNKRVIYLNGKALTLYILSEDSLVNAHSDLFG